MNFDWTLYLTLTWKYNFIVHNLANIYLFNIKNGGTRKKCQICLKLTIKQQKTLLAIKTPNDVINDALVFLL